jgi:hypothetical protein
VLPLCQLLETFPLPQTLSVSFCCHRVQHGPGLYVFHVLTLGYFLPVTCISVTLKISYESPFFIQELSDQPSLSLLTFWERIKSFCSSVSLIHKTKPLLFSPAFQVRKNKLVNVAWTRAPVRLKDTASWLAVWLKQ